MIESIVDRVSALEGASNRGLETDDVTASEFRLFKWLGTFALATVVAGFGLLYEQISDVRVGMERLHGQVLREIYDLRETMHAEHNSIREDLSDVRERVASVETHLQRGNADNG